jgi:hypothetical protein
MNKIGERVADALKAQFRTLNAEWFVDDAKNDGPCDMTPWNLLTTAAIEAMREPTKAMVEAAAKAAYENAFGDPQESPSDWPDNLYCSPDADMFRDAARAAIKAAIDAALKE